MQGVIQQWGDLMEVTGGALKLDQKAIGTWLNMCGSVAHGLLLMTTAKIGGVNGFDLMALSADNELACSVIRPLRCWAYSWHHQERIQAW